VHRLLVLSALLMTLMVAGCHTGAKISDIKRTGVFIESGDELVEIPRLGTLGSVYGPRLHPEIPDDSIPVVNDVGPIYVNLPDVPVTSLRGIEWHGYRLGGNGSADSRSTATAQDWKVVPIVTEPTSTAGIYKVMVGAADAKTRRWKPEISHEYFGLTAGDGYKGGPVWGVKIR
jgi:hypothetical protein